MMSMPFTSRTGAIKSIRVVETINYNSDIIHIKLEPTYSWPTWMAPRDICLARYWKQNTDGSFVICLDSAAHIECPLIEDHVRAELHAVYFVSPPKVSQ
jgi:hypothetical protein